MEMRRMRFHLYARVSSLDSNVDQMVAEMVAWCDRHGHDVASIIKDKESGRIPLSEREKFKDLISKIPFSDADGVLVLALDRVSRNWYDENVIEKAFASHWDTCKLVSCWDRVDLDSASGRFMFRMQLNMACYEVERMFERQKIGIKRAKAEGKYKGRMQGSKNKRKPLGWQKKWRKHK